MMSSSENPVDPIKELRLRRWARKHYAPAGERGASWHPIVLDEMQSRDAELAAEYRWSEEYSKMTAYVPLAPGSVHVVHPGHPDCGDPKMLSQLVETEVYIHG